MQLQRSTVDLEPPRFPETARTARAYDLRCLGCGAAARVVLECMDPERLPLRCLGCRSDAVVANLMTPPRSES